MSEEEKENDTQTLGAFLRNTRESSGLSLDDARDATKITKPILQAIEGDDFESMPAEAFCRGFYVMYAKFLQLDSGEVLARYLESRGLPPTPSTEQSQPPISKSGHFSTFAEPSPMSPRLGQTIVLLVCLAAIIGICWSLNWNPVSYINAKLGLLQDSAPQELRKQEEPIPSSGAEVTKPAASPAPQEAIQQAVARTTEMTPPSPVQETVSPPVEEIAPPEAVREEAEEEDITPAPSSREVMEQNTTERRDAAITPYHLEMNFQSSGTLTATLDNGFFIDKHYVTGQTMQWEVEKSIIIDMPEKIRASLRLNGIELPLPSPVNGRRQLSLPEDFLN